jgi:hypothetical protein
VPHCPVRYSAREVVVGVDREAMFLPKSVETVRLGQSKFVLA